MKTKPGPEKNILVVYDFTTYDLRRAVRGARLRPDASQREFQAALQRYAQRHALVTQTGRPKRWPGVVWCAYVGAERRAEAGLAPRRDEKTTEAP